jgi:ribonuclease Z
MATKRAVRSVLAYSEADHSGFEITFLGSSSAVPTHDRGLSCTAIRVNQSDVYIVDCGENAQGKFVRSHLRGRDIKGIFITHLHGDHVSGLGGMLQLCDVDHGDHVPTTPVHIYGPIGLAAHLRYSLGSTHNRIRFPFCIHELADLNAYSMLGASVTVPPAHSHPEMPASQVHATNGVFQWYGFAYVI